MASEVAVQAVMNDSEDWLLEQLESEDLDGWAILKMLRGLAVQGDLAKARDLCDLTLDTLCERGPKDVLLSALRLRIGRLADENGGMASLAAGILDRGFSDRLGKAFLASLKESSEKLTIAESILRLETLIRLKEGQYCVDKTWGFGVVKRLDDFYKRVTIDFNKKPGHQMSFAYAGETLKIVDEEHLLAVRHREPEKIQNLLSAQPDELIRLALRSYGPRSVPELQELFVEEGLCEDKDWKSIWDQARKVLKQDPLVLIPAKRAERIELLSKAITYDGAWFARLAGERDPKRIMELSQELKTAGELQDLNDAARAVLGGRLRFAFLAAESQSDWPYAAKLLLQCVACGFAADCTIGELDMRALALELMRESRLEGALYGLPAGDIERLVALLDTVDGASLTERIKVALPNAPAHVVEAVMPYLLSGEAAPDIMQSLREGIRGGTASGALLLWAGQHWDETEQYTVCSALELLQAIVRELELPADLERRRNQKLLRGMFDNRDWIEAAFTRLDVASRETLMMHIRDSRGWDGAGRRSVMAKVIKMFPELEAVAAAERKPKQAKQSARWTSWRSYREKQEQLRELVEVSIPENSKEIGVARSYGDLRENFEYQAAKDQQRLLLRRKAELERDLGEVKGTDFKGVQTQVVGMGTGVDLARPGGQAERLWILGEWDRDETLAIISNQSEMAKALEGLAQGDTGVLPGDPAGGESTVLGVVALSEPVRVWISQRDSENG